MTMARATSILVVDDDDAIRNKLQVLLEASGFAVDVAASGADALQKLSSTRFDVAVIDYMMPGMTGIDLARELEGRPSRPLTILISGGIVPDERPAIDAFLRKPFETNELLTVIARVSES